MLNELYVDLDRMTIKATPVEDNSPSGKALAVNRMLEDPHPEKALYLTGYTPLAAAGLGFAGKLNLYGISLLGNNLQGSRSGGIISSYLTRLGIIGIKITGKTEQKHILHIDKKGQCCLTPLSLYGSDISGTIEFSRRLYDHHGNEIAIAITDPMSTGFMYNAIVCNAAKGYLPQRAAGRGTNIFGKNGLVGIVVEKSDTFIHRPEFDKTKMAHLLRRINKTKANITLKGSSDPNRPLLGGTYGSAAHFRFDLGHGLTNLFRDANVPENVLDAILPDAIVQKQIARSQQSGIKIKRHSCLPGCPNQCSQMVILPDAENGFRKAKAGEWETYQGLINLGIFDNTVNLTSWVIEHSNNYAYDHIEGLVTLAALALVSEIKEDTGVRYGDSSSIKKALEEAVTGKTTLGKLVQKGAKTIEDYFAIERHFTVGGHALPFHNGRSILQTGIGLTWTYGRHGESCAGPGRHNFLGEPYDASDRTLAPEALVLNTIHGMILYGAMDDLGLCFFMGPSIDSLVDNSMLLSCMGIKADVKEMIASSAQSLSKIHEFNKQRGALIQALPDIFYHKPTHGNSQTIDNAVKFIVPFEIIKDYGAKVLNDVAQGNVTIPESVLKKSISRYE